MDEITKELLDALKTIESWNSHTTAYAVDFGSNGVRDFYRAIARQSIAKAEATLATPQPSADNPDRACCGTFKGTPHRSTCAKYRGKKPAPQPSDDGWIPWEGGECPVAHGTVVDVR
ncbi:MAG: hypothetical protein ACKO0Z_24495, partial [Betaproteobacteria bacterium]